ncbi:hypothetical protein IG631_02939 [Alternaria alternata]|nr:hypothetical protein IG631_02939 [Alternaria alternata]
MRKPLQTEGLPQKSNSCRAVGLLVPCVIADGCSCRERRHVVAVTPTQLPAYPPGRDLIRSWLEEMRSAYHEIQNRSSIRSGCECECGVRISEK